MRDHSQHIEVSRDEAVSSMLAALQDAGFRKKASRERERVALIESYGRVLAVDICAKTDVPNVLTCCMDSVAVHWDDFADLAEGDVPDTSSWTRGKEWQFANTGIAMPAGFDTAIVIEYIEVSDDEQSIKILAAPSKRYAGTRQPGSTMARGDVVLPAGIIITPDHAATISSAGHSSVLVEKKPRVSFMPTGNELIPANLPFSQSAPGFYAGYGHVFESNSVLARGKVEQWGGAFSCFDIVPDEYEVIKRTILEAVTISDIVVLNAGSSKGSDDWSVEVLEEIGTVLYHQVSHGPGHHSFGAVVDGTPIIGISGPPGGASFTLGFYLRPIIKAWLGLEPEPNTLQARLKGSLGKNKSAKLAKVKAAGETRPAVATNPGEKFTSVRFVKLEEEPDGTLVAIPIERGDANKPGIGTTAIYMLEAAIDDEYPVEGDIVTVELR